MSYPFVRTSYKNKEDAEREFSGGINSLRLGKINTIFDSVTLTANVASTTITLPPGILSATSFISFMPLTANAATELYGATMYVTSANIDPANNQYTITHANNAQTDRTFRVAIFG